MGWQDRSYYRDSSQGATNPFMWLLNGSVPLFTAFGIRVRMHVSLLLLLIFSLLTAEAKHGMGWQNALTFDITVFGVILLHEFGHCFAARSVGGDAKDILLWPLGGLAYADAPQRAWPQLVTVAGGPAVNLIICAVTGIGMLFCGYGIGKWPWSPFQINFAPPSDLLPYCLWFVFIISWGNFLFNMILIVYPMDAWRTFQAILWFRMGYYRSMMIALNVGMVYAVPVALWGLLHIASWYGFVLLMIGGNGFYACYTMRAMMRAEGPWGFQEEDGPDYSASLFQPEPAASPRHKKLSKRIIRRAQKREADERAEQDRVDHILAKVSAAGMNSLTWWEKRTLKKATDRQRKRDADLRHEMKSKGF